MNNYIPACDTFPDEDFDFHVKTTEIDVETWETCYDIEANPRCYDCFLIERCVTAIMETLAKSHWVSMDKVTQERDKKVN